MKGLDFWLSFPLKRRSINPREKERYSLPCGASLLPSRLETSSLDAPSKSTAGIQGSTVATAAYPELRDWATVSCLYKDRGTYDACDVLR